MVSIRYGVALAAIIFSASAVSAQSLSGAEVKGLLIGKTEQGQVVEPSSEDIGKRGTRYAIAYRANGTLAYSTNKGRSGIGEWFVNEDALCRSIDDGDAYCRRIVKKRNGYQGVGFRSGTLRYKFTIQ